MSQNPSYLGTVPMTKIHDCQSIGHRVGGTGLSGPAWPRIPASRRCQPGLCAVAPCRLLWHCWACRSSPVAALSSWSRFRRRHRQCLWASLMPVESNWGRMYPARAGGLLRADQPPSSGAAVATEGGAESLVLPAQPEPFYLLPPRGW